MSSVFVVTVESETEHTVILGVYFSEKDAKSAATNYTKESELEFKRKITKKEETEPVEAKRVLFLEKESETSVCVTTVKCEIPASKKKVKDPNAPKKNMSAYMFYAVENRAKLKEKNPDATFNDLSKLVGESWKKLTDKQKQPYITKSDSDKTRYQQAAKDYTEATVAE